jgi:hypothetical protein
MRLTIFSFPPWPASAAFRGAAFSGAFGHTRADAPGKRFRHRFARLHRTVSGGHVNPQATRENERAHDFESSMCRARQCVPAAAARRAVPR